MPPAPEAGFFLAEEIMAPNLSVIVGGGGSPPTYKFIEGEVTDTRLMGVLGMHLRWSLPESPGPDLHQFFYFDIEELGLDSLAIYRGDDEIAVDIAGKVAFGSLGGKMVEISEREARYLVNFFIDDTVKKGEKLPEQIEELDFISSKPSDLSDDEVFFPRPQALRAPDDGLCNRTLLPHAPLRKRS